MKFEITGRDDKGNPTHVHTDDGFVMCSRQYRGDEDGWMEDQIDPREFPAIRTGRDMEWLVAEVNRLRRENFHLQQQVKMWTKAAGYGN